jgi:FAD/FMN-containing dehydrogenase
MTPRPDLQGIFRDDLRARAAYAEAAGIYRILPRAVALPRDEEDLIRLVCWAAGHSVSLIPRGAGSAMGGGNVGDGVIVDLTGMTNPQLAIHPAKRRAVTGAPVTLAQLNAQAMPYQLRLPPDPSSGGWATLGGMVSTNAAGARSVRYGSVRHWVDWLRLVTADGETVTLRRGHPPPQSATLARFGREAEPAIRQAASLVAAKFPRTRKNSSGYALDAFLASGELVDLIIGAEGTLGFISEIGWRLDQVPRFRAGLRAGFRSLDEVAGAVELLLGCTPSAIELLDRSFLELVARVGLAGAGYRFSETEALLLVELERDDPQSLRSGLEQATALMRPLAYSVDTAFTAESAERLWAIRHAASPILARLPEQQRSLQVIEDACVPLARMGQYIRLVRQAAARRQIPAVIFGHAGDGHLHVNLLPDVTRSGWERDVADLLDEVTEGVVQLGGTPSGEHGDGRLRSSVLRQVFGTEIVSLFRRLKDSFDPSGILNPGVILPSAEPPVSRLKVGASALALPPDIERGLREIEQTAGYARSRLELAEELGAKS